MDKSAPPPFHIAERVWDWERDMLGPLGWKKPCLAILKDDLFAGSNAPADNIVAAAAFAVMAAKQWTRFIVWTANPNAMRSWLDWAIGETKAQQRFTAPAIADHAAGQFFARGALKIAEGLYRAAGISAGKHFPLKNVFLATVVSTQQEVEARLPELMLCKHENSIVICDPLKERLDVRCWLHLPPCPKHPGEVKAGWGHLDCDCRPHCEKHAKEGRMGCIGWVVAGGGYGPNAKPSPLEGLSFLVEQGRDANVPVFISRLGARPTGNIFDWSPAKLPMINPHLANKDEWCLHAPKGDNVNEWPGVLRVQQRPRWGMRLADVKSNPPASIERAAK